MKYRKKPVVIEAWQFTKQNYQNGVPGFIKHTGFKKVILWSQYGGDEIGGEIKTLEGIMKVSENDWIIKGVKGEFYPCKPDIFAQTYEEVLPQATESNEQPSDSRPSELSAYGNDCPSGNCEV